MNTGYWHKGERIKEGAVPPDGINKTVWADEDYEKFEEWVEYSEEELVIRAEKEKRAIALAEREAFLVDAPNRMEAAEQGVVDTQEAVAELGVLAADNSVSIEDLMDAIAELGALVAGE